MTTEAIQAASELIDEVDAVLDYETDDDMQKAVDILRGEVAASALTQAGVYGLIDEVDAHLDLVDDQDMLTARNALEDLFPRDIHATLAP